jgi:hypothetical protein
MSLGPGNPPTESSENPVRARPPGYFNLNALIRSAYADSSRAYTA